MPPEPSLVLPATLLVAGLLMVAAEFFLPTVILGFIGAIVSCLGIYLSAARGAGVCLVFAAVFVIGLALEFVFFRRILPGTLIGRALENHARNATTAVPPADDFARYVGRTAVAKTVLAPSGTVEVDGVLLEAFSLDGFVERAASVVVTEAAAGRVTVRVVR